MRRSRSSVPAHADLPPTTLALVVFDRTWYVVPAAIGAFFRRSAVRRWPSPAGRVTGTAPVASGIRLAVGRT